MKDVAGYEPVIDMKRPWDAVMEMAIEDDEKWWVDHVVDPCRDITLQQEEPECVHGR